MIGLFSSSTSKIKKKNDALLKKARLALDVRKAEFRNNAVSKLKFLHPDMQFCANIQDADFFAYSAEHDRFEYGRFLDRYLPSLLELEDHAEESEFDQKICIFLKDIQTYVAQPDESVPERYKKYAEWNFKNTVEKFGSSGYILGDESYVPFDIRLYKNERIFARSTTAKPKGSGYFSEKLYKNIVEDIQGAAGHVSTIKLEIVFTNWGSFISKRTCFTYIDPPRKIQSASRDHFITVCSQFSPFLSAMEHYLVRRSKEDHFRDFGDEDDRYLGL